MGRRRRSTAFRRSDRPGWHCRHMWLGGRVQLGQRIDDTIAVACGDQHMMGQFGAAHGCGQNARSTRSACRRTPSHSSIRPCIETHNLARGKPARSDAPAPPVALHGRPTELDARWQWPPPRWPTAGRRCRADDDTVKARWRRLPTRPGRSIKCHAGLARGSGASCAAIANRNAPSLDHPQETMQCAAMATHFYIWRRPSSPA